ncbi:hypothetical protein ACCH75_004553 [Vibrio parahaemolyticus]|uniref:hypothetical protein n=6 Tax=Vibrio parahaemolyticus TaxID=670 RepID=UPI00112043AA|nr:hypothetical protein [Vibrio parahaemolyticus]EGR3456779.1 hypothetical protein [Vibrio parahaemolyticus]MQC32883.1 hypothetical protein [Vibrio parahaemolyticus]TOG28173.1 hypothetical protein CGJ04_23470 [Vibrio parahaemolyticus]HCM1572495.1 hypothetical protein [Vibrio parahaemolyticus]
MGNIVCSTQEILLDSDLSQIGSTHISIDMLDPSHPKVGEDLRNQILTQRYSNRLIEDGIETGNITLDDNGKAHVSSKLNFASFLGLVLESYCVSELNRNKATIATEAFRWVTGVRSTSETVCQYDAVGTGFLTTKTKMPEYYMPQHNLDIIFLKKLQEINDFTPALARDTKNITGIQVKAVNRNLGEQIIEPILSGKYKKVLTLLQHPSRKHTYDYCVDLIKIKRVKGEINDSQMWDLFDAIRSPASLGFSQTAIDNYVHFAWQWFNGNTAKFVTDEHYLNAVGLEIKGYKFNNGVLVPSLIS